MRSESNADQLQFKRYASRLNMFCNVHAMTVPDVCQRCCQRQHMTLWQGCAPD